MNPNTMPLEAETRVLIDRSLENLGWKLSGKDQNVYYEQPRSEAEKKKLCGKRPDYVLYSKDSDKPLIVIEAKKKGVRLDSALEQGIQYAKAIEAPLVFATDGVFCKAFHTVANRPPILNGEEIDEFIREALALRYLTSYEVNTVSPKVQYDRKELIRIFDEANNMLRGEGLRAGIERFGEFANILFLKLISESEQIKRESGIPTKFEVACSWDSIKQIPISTRIEYINKTVYDKLNLLYDTDIFTPLQIRDASILKEIMDKLDPLMLTDVDSDVKGDAFEYFLKASTSTKNDLGEYFTPRHIVKTMVRLVNPQIGEKIYDPFCGTGGFLIESFRYIHNNMARTEANMKTLRESTVYGNEITNTARITKMNMILAGDGHSNIKMLDSLANPIDGTETYMENGVLHHRGFDIVLANMPYSQKTKHGNLYDLPSTNGDSICVQHCMKAINSAAENGRMALVVPEGFLFRKDLTKTREYLLGHCQLQSIISLPQGVFLPYTGVKTDIIYATKVNKKVKSSEKKKDFWYFDVKSDGYTLDNHRRKLEMPSDLAKYEEYRKLDEEQTDDMLKVGFEVIPLEKVRQNSFVLVGSRYRVPTPLSANSYVMTKLSDVANLIRGITNLIAVNYKYGQYQFAYFGLHLLYMTYIYCTAWKIGQIEPERYKDAIVFARPYNGRERDLKIEDADSIFAYSLIPEKDIARLFKIIGLDRSQISAVGELVDTRNEMAHASGKFEILTEEGFDAKASSVFTSISCIHSCMDKLIRKWCKEVLLSFCCGEYDGYDNPKDVIAEQMIQSFKLSVNELLVCNEMSVSSLITEHRGYQTKLKDFKKAISDHCQEMGYI